MALISKAVWAGVGGYDHVRTGWEDFDLWCKLAEHGLRGERVPGGPLAEYRVHRASMIKSANARPETVRWMMDHLEQRHPWLKLDLDAPQFVPKASSEGEFLPSQGAANSTRMKRLLPLLRCPDTGGRLAVSSKGDTLISEDGSRHWQILSGRPLLFPGMTTPNINPDTHISNPYPIAQSR